MSKEQLSSYDAFVISALIWIRENDDLQWINNLLDKLPNIPIVPISLGLQAQDISNDFKLKSEAVKAISRLAERCNLIGVRGEFTASVLEKAGIKNVEVIGCPSVYYPFMSGNLGNFSLDAANPKPIVNARTLSGITNSCEMEFLLYCAKHRIPFVDQTPWGLDRSQKFYDNRINSYLLSFRKIFLSIESWSEYLQPFDFSLGGRFHGNVIALWNNIPALFFVSDSRTKEMCNFFKMPHINLLDFDQSKPLDYYYKKADYSDFKDRIFILTEKYISFLRKNNLPLRPQIKGIEKIAKVSTVKNMPNFPLIDFSTCNTLWNWDSESWSILPEKNKVTFISHGKDEKWVSIPFVAPLKKGIPYHYKFKMKWQCKESLRLLIGNKETRKNQIVRNLDKNGEGTIEGIFFIEEDIFDVFFMTSSDFDTDDYVSITYAHIEENNVLFEG